MGMLLDDGKYMGLDISIFGLKDMAGILCCEPCHTLDAFVLGSLLIYRVAIIQENKDFLESKSTGNLPKIHKSLIFPLCSSYFATDLNIFY